jgi:cyclase
MSPPTWLFGPGRALTRFGEQPVFKEGLYRIAGDTYAWMVPNGSWGETNIGLIDCGGASVMVDTCWDLRYTREMLDACQHISQASPIDIVINTHADGDHCWGNQLFKGREIIATHACIHQMHHMHPRSLQALRWGGALMSHLPCVGGIDQFGHYMHEMFKPYDFSGITITDPNQGFSRQKTVDVRGVEIVITEVGPGHTDGDAIVHLPSRRVAYAGDILFVGVTPVMWSGPCDKLVAGLKHLQSLDVDTIVPGHGPLATAADVQAMIDYWDFAQNALWRCSQHGMSAAQAARDVIFSADFAHQPWGRWDSPERLLTSAHTFYRHWGIAQPTLPGKLGVMDLLRKQARLAFDLPHATPRVMRHRR